MSFWIARIASGAVFLVLAVALAAVVPAQAADDDKKVEVGKAAPDIELPATLVEKSLPDQKDAKTLHLKDLQGKKNVVLYFYPKAMTGG